jgi:hypothetical protein
MKMTIKAYHAVAEWKWDHSSDEDKCSICSTELEGTCGCPFPGNGCPISETSHSSRQATHAPNTDFNPKCSDRAMHAHLSHALHRQLAEISTIARPLSSMSTSLPTGRGGCLEWRCDSKQWQKCGCSGL